MIHLKTKSFNAAVQISLKFQKKVPQRNFVKSGHFGTVWYFSSRFNGRPESQGIIRILASRSAQLIAAAAVHTMYTVHRRTEIVRINRSTQYIHTGLCVYSL